jgi:hypothetical protein
MVVLATRCYVEGDARERTLASLDALVGDAMGDLDVDWTIGVRDDGFPSVTLEGSDATVGRNLLREQWGEVTPHLQDGEAAVGTLEGWSEDGLELDAGQSVTVPPAGIGLGQGTPSQIRTRFGLVQHLPLRFVPGEPPRLADAERDRLYDWRRGDGRVNVNSTTRAAVRATVNRAGHARDIVTVERLGLLEQSIVCAPGTDPPGLVAAIGEYLPSELLAVVT